MNAKGWKIAVIIQTIFVVVLAIALVFQSNGNKVLKEENKLLSNDNKTLQKKIDLRNEEIQHHLKTINNLKVMLESWDSLLAGKNFIYEEDIINISNDFNDNISFLSKYLEQTNSIGGEIDSTNNNK